MTSCFFTDYVAWKLWIRLFDTSGLVSLFIGVFHEFESVGRGMRNDAKALLGKALFVSLWVLGFKIADF